MGSQMADSENPLVPVYVPALTLLLTNLERQKGAPLTEHEVLEARNVATRIVPPRSKADQHARARGFEDLDPVHCWEQWQLLRAQGKEE